MKEKYSLKMLFLLFIILFACSSIAVIADDDLSVVGIITLDATVETDDGGSYMIGENENSAAVESLAGKRVELNGKLSELEGELFFFVSDYVVLEDLQ